MEEKEIPKIKEFFTPGPKVNHHKNKESTAWESFSQDSLYQGRYFQAFLQFCLGDCSFLKGLVEAHFSSGVFLVKYSLPV